MDKTTILVTGTGGGGIGEQVIKCLRLSTIDTWVVATDTTSISKGKIDGDEFIIAPLASADNYINFIIDLCLSKNIHIVIPGSEIELKVFSANRDIFIKNNIHLLINSDEILRICLDKNQSSEFLKKNNFDAPTSFSIMDVKQLNDITIYPLVLKPSIGGGGSMNTLIAQNKEELQVFGQFLLNQYDEFIAQEYIGDANSEYTVGVLSTKEGVVVNSFVLKRNILSGLGSKIKLLNKTNKEALGKYLVISSGISQGEIVKNDLIAQTCERIATKLHSVGPLNIQCRLVDNKVYVFEINPRFSGTSPMRALAGFNEIEICIKNTILKQTKFERVDFKVGHVVRGLNEHFV